MKGYLYEYLGAGPYHYESFAVIALLSISCRIRQLPFVAGWHGIKPQRYQDKLCGFLGRELPVKVQQERKIGTE